MADAAGMETGDIKFDQRLPRVAEFDGLRGILASWVAISHILLWSGFATIHHQERIWSIFVYAQPAVQTFIILSGFAISFLLHSKKTSYLTFMRGRFFRIYPTYLVCLLLGIATFNLIPEIVSNVSWQADHYFQIHFNVGHVFASEAAHPMLHTLCHLTLLHGIVPKGESLVLASLSDSSSTLLPPAWSISLEWQYYLVAPLIAVSVLSSSRILLLAIVAYIGINHCSSFQNPMPAFLPAQLHLFLIGIASYHVYAYFAINPRFRSAKSHIFTAAFLALMLLIELDRFAWMIWGVVFGGLFAERWGVFGRFLVVIRNVLLHPWLQRLGHISYPLYLVHWPIIIIWLAILIRWKPAMTSYEALSWLSLLALPSCLLAAALLHKYVEKPMMKLGKS